MIPFFSIVGLGGNSNPVGSNTENLPANTVNKNMGLLHIKEIMNGDNPGYRQ